MNRKDPTSVVVATALLAAMTQATVAEELGIYSVRLSTNGVTLAWTNPGPAQAYTVQVKDSLAGNWSPAPTRYRWPCVATRWAEPGKPVRGARFYRVMAEPMRIPNRGALLGVTLRQSLSTNNVKTTLAGNGIDPVAVQWPVAFYKVKYETVDPFGLPITASGALYLPQGPTNGLPLCSYQHWLSIPKSAAPSNGNLVPENAFGVMFATTGYAALLPDYIGMGDSPGFPAYGHVATEATAVVDMLRAVRSFCGTNGTALNRQVFLAGYSQGGGATMAAQRELEANYTDEFTITASAPMAGAYDMSGTMLDLVLTNRNYASGAGIVATMAAYLPIYQLADTVEELLRPPYDRSLPPLLYNSHEFWELNSALPGETLSILRPDYYASLRKDDNHPLRLALRDNDVYQWTPRAPMRMYHCSGDTGSPYAMSAMVYQYFTNHGATAVSLIDPGLPARLDHAPCLIPSMLAAKQWFDSLKQ